MRIKRTQTVPLSHSLSSSSSAALATVLAATVVGPSRAKPFLFHGAPFCGSIHSPLSFCDFFSYHLFKSPHGHGPVRISLVAP
ncbi:hypothetical protein E2542_SST13871 [Spatholobus suberectus]|nr:hypothetical protein E2542_SST13871 [Spatholobus suberectus]